MLQWHRCLRSAVRSLVKMVNKIYVVTHKDYKMPESELYQSITVGPNKDNLKLSSVRDDTGENIADKNNQYSELTALYWIWKNDHSDNVGIVHYRRYLATNPRLGYEGILSDSDVSSILKTCDVIMTKPRFYIEGVAKHYINCHKTQHEQCKKQLDILGEVIKDQQPDYYNSYIAVINNRNAHMFNMFVMRKELLNKYCKWLFPILFEAEKKIVENDVSYERLMGSLSEFLLDVWVKQNNLKYKNIGLLQTEMDFWKRVQRFIYRRFLEK